MGKSRIATLSADGEAFYGVIVPGGAVSLSEHFPQWPTLREVIENQALTTLEEKAYGMEITHLDGSYHFEIPIPAPEKIICVGANFPESNAEYKDSKGAPANMSLFIRFARSFVGHEAPLIRPKASGQLDYEGEIAVVIGKGGRHIAQENALDHIAALTLCNEGTLRDWEHHAKFNVTQGKNVDGSGAMGPWLVPFTDPSQIADVALSTKVNGELRQDDRTGRMIFPVARQIAYISTFTTLVPGDIIITGTPTGAGAWLNPPVFLKPGDVIEVMAEGIGTLTNGVVNEA
ncbi:MAG: fumarylacetoacetate hydrolase family protein [Rhodobacteraceae bacterium]|nr:fumarylacetoacetate hydrolase family protein [Paracoccaceae bacterium]